MLSPCPFHGPATVVREAPGTVRCRVCGHIRQTGPSTHSPVEEAYFGREYRDQYGRTYEEDEPHLRALARRRLDRISRYTSLRGKSILDIGCAMGFFIAEAERLGCRAYGVEPSAYASAKAAGHAAGKVITSPWQPDLFPGRRFDVITLWYVLEHLPEPHDLLGDISSRLRPGGVIAVACPNAAGATYRWARQRFYDTRPGDHRADFTPTSMSLALRRHGVRPRRFVAAGVHYPRAETYLRLPRWAAPLVRPLYEAAARRLQWGDTFEVYGVKER